MLVHAAQQKFASNASEDRVAELEGLQQFLNEGIAAVDAAAKEMAAPADRIRELLSSKDKKAALLDLASTSSLLWATPQGIYWSFIGAACCRDGLKALCTSRSQSTPCHTNVCPFVKCDSAGSSRVCAW